MKVWKKTVIICIVIFVVFGLIFSNQSEATTLVDISKKFGAESNGKVSYSTFKKIIGNLLGFLQIASGLISIIIIATTGYNYIVAPTPDLKGELKRKMLPIILGLVLVFCAMSIAKFIVGAIQ